MTTDFKNIANHWGREACFAAIVFIALLFGASAAAQTPRVGVLVQEMGRAQSQSIKGLTEELKRLGYRERRDFALEMRNVKGNRAALQPAAAELVAQKVKLIFTTGTSATRAAIAATPEIPVLFVHPGDPVAAGLMKNAEERAKNLTGIAAYAAQTTERRLALFKEIMPGLKKIWVFFDGNNAVSRDYFKLAEGAAKKIQVEAVGYPIKSGDELKTTLASLPAESGAGGVPLRPGEVVRQGANGILI
jgi:putative tryptophan/tyrosine transport system substrate-binding protein